jgi:hypothetical protein
MCNFNILSACGRFIRRDLVIKRTTARLKLGLSRDKRFVYLSTHKFLRNSLHAARTQALLLHLRECPIVSRTTTTNDLTALITGNLVCRLFFDYIVAIV